MADKTKIEWTDATWNPLRGCTRVSEGCRNCYAEAVAARFSGPGQPYEGLAKWVDRPGEKRKARWTGKVTLVESVLDQPLRWRHPRRIFVNSMSDLFQESVPDEWIDRIFFVMALAPQHDFQILTKRPERMRDYLSRFRPAKSGHPNDPSDHYPYVTRDGVSAADRPERSPLFHAKEGWPLPNVWIGVSVEDQATADARIPILLDTPAAVRWVSAEPLLGPLELETAWHGESALNSECWGDCAWCSKGFTPLHNCKWGRGDWEKGRSGLDWVVAGGESGPGARPMHPDWARLIRDQCEAAEVPFLFKQWGEFQEFDTGPPPHEQVDADSDIADAFLNSARKPSWITLDGCHIFTLDELPADTPCRLIERVGKKAAGRLLDGKLHDGYPKVQA